MKLNNHYHLSFNWAVWVRIPRQVCRKVNKKKRGKNEYDN